MKKRILLMIIALVATTLTGCSSVYYSGGVLYSKQTPEVSVILGPEKVYTEPSSGTKISMPACCWAGKMLESGRPLTPEEKGEIVEILNIYGPQTRSTSSNHKCIVYNVYTLQ